MQILKSGQPDPAYQKWLDKRYVPKIKLGTTPEPVCAPDYEWMAAREDRTARHNGEMIYQRGK